MSQSNTPWTVVKELATVPNIGPSKMLSRCLIKTKTHPSMIMELRTYNLHEDDDSPMVEAILRRSVAHKLGSAAASFVQPVYKHWREDVPTAADPSQDAGQQKKPRSTQRFQILMQAEQDIDVVKMTLKQFDQLRRGQTQQGQQQPEEQSHQHHHEGKWQEEELWYLLICVSKVLNASHQCDYAHGNINMSAVEVVLPPGSSDPKAATLSQKSFRVVSLAQSKHHPILVQECADHQVPSLSYFDSSLYTRAQPEFPPEALRYLGYLKVHQQNKGKGGPNDDDLFTSPIENFYALDMYYLGMLLLRLALPSGFPLPSPKKGRQWSNFLSLRMAQGSCVLKELEGRGYSPTFQAVVAQLLQIDFAKRPSADVALASCGFFKVLRDKKGHSSPRSHQHQRSPRSERRDSSPPAQVSSSLEQRESSPRSEARRQLLKVKPPKIAVISSYSKRNTQMIRKSLKEKSHIGDTSLPCSMGQSLNAHARYYEGTKVAVFLPPRPPTAVAPEEEETDKSPLRFNALVAAQLSV